MRIYRIAQNIVVYHGTNQPIESFDEFRLGCNTKACSAYDGFFFTEDFEEAKRYADLAANRLVQNMVEQEKKEAKLMKRMDFAEKRRNWDLYEELTRELEETSLGAIRAAPGGHRVYVVKLNVSNPYVVEDAGKANAGKVQEYIKTAKEKGHDSVYLKQILDGYDYPTNQWVVFNPGQIQIIEEIPIEQG